VGKQGNYNYYLHEITGVMHGLLLLNMNLTSQFLKEQSPATKASG